MTARAQPWRPRVPAQRALDAIRETGAVAGDLPAAPSLVTRRASTGSGARTEHDVGCAELAHIEVAGARDDLRHGVTLAARHGRGKLGLAMQAVRAGVGHRIASGPVALAAARGAVADVDATVAVQAGRAQRAARRVRFHVTAGAVPCVVIDGRRAVAIATAERSRFMPARLCARATAVVAAHRAAIGRRIESRLGARELAIEAHVYGAIAVAAGQILGGGRMAGAAGDRLGAQARALYVRAVRIVLGSVERAALSGRMRALAAVAVAGSASQHAARTVVTGRAGGRRRSRARDVIGCDGSALVTPPAGLGMVAIAKRTEPVLGCQPPVPLDRARVGDSGRMNAVIAQRRASQHERLQPLSLGRLEQALVSLALEGLQDGGTAVRRPDGSRVRRRVGTAEQARVVVHAIAASRIRGPVTALAARFEQRGHVALVHRTRVRSLTRLATGCEQDEQRERAAAEPISR